MLWFIFLLICLIALSQTPLLVDLLRLLFPQWRIKRLTDKLSVYLLRILMTTFFITGLGQHMFVFIPLMPNVPFRSVKLLFHCVFAYWVWFNMTINYYLATFLCPGYCADSAVPSEESSSSLPSIPKSDTGSGDIQRSSFPSTEHTSSGLSTRNNLSTNQPQQRIIEWVLPHVFPPLTTDTTTAPCAARPFYTWTTTVNHIESIIRS